MNKSLVSTLRVAALSSTLFLIPVSASAKDSAAADPTAQALDSIGVVPVKAAGPYVQIGSYRIHVRMRLGRPNAMLPDGTWLYNDISADNSAAKGTLVVRFDQGKVSQLSLVSPAVATAMLRAPAPKQGGTLVAGR